jgi:hypothetical protein
VELQQNLERIGKQGLGLAAISYDSVDVLKNFAGRKGITFPLLSDPDSKIVKSFGILNASVAPNSPQYGIPYPGTFVLDARGRIVSKYFLDDFRERISASDILSRQFKVAPEDARESSDTKRLTVATAASMSVARPGEAIVLSLEVDLKPKMHVYAPGVKDYIPIDWKLDEAGVAKSQPAQYPPSRQMRLKVIKETVPVYLGRVRMSREVTFASENILRPLVSPTGELTLKGSFRYQACDERECYPPETVPLEWHFRFAALERERVPAQLQRKGR